VVDDIVVEFGNALYQDTIDRFVSGQPVDNADLRPVWRNTTQSPGETWDAPVYEQFFRTVRAHPASVIAKQVLAKGRRALICYGLDHLTHGGSLAGILERAGERLYAIADFVPAAGDPGGLARRFSRHAQDMVIPTAGTWLGSVDAGLFSADGPDRPQA
jgi:hypothetical protein